ncbi:ribosomal protein S5 domain 2-type protein [Lipomyces chichibuensis]|uniref:ribosomal protein S5 domain 2-type protein n=1 Tax=Lipomyces chichibuensis TaxID=1546026 RepID=UPI0033430B67
MSESLQEEVFSINAIYSEECMVQQASTIYVVHPPSLPEASIQMSFPFSYPDAPPIILSVSIPESQQEYIPRMDVQALTDILLGCYHSGEVCVFDFLDELREVLKVDEEYYEQRKLMSSDACAGVNNGDSSDGEFDSENADNWATSDMVVDRKSKFIARAMEVHSVAEAKANLAVLKANKKIAKATHNMTAWRIKTDREGITIQDCDDDGESAAGGRLLHLLEDLWNVMVVVSRWYGGIHLGPDRFKHINVTARNALVKGGFVQDSTHHVDKKGKSSRKSK